MPTSNSSAPNVGANDLPSDTRTTLLETAAQIFNDVGYYGTDTNRIARAAGYAPATFYKHFKNKLEIFLECYPRVEPSLGELISDLDSDPSIVVGARRAVYRIFEHRRRWMGCYKSLRALALTDAAAAQAYTERKRAAADAVVRLFAYMGSEISGADAFVAQHLVSNMADAVVDGLPEDLDVEVDEVVDVLLGLLARIAKIDIEEAEILLAEKP
ncbi:MAG: TetR/AcrR family transcriptional regulator [Myxococcota bacterium]